MKLRAVSLAILLLSGTLAWSQRDPRTAPSPKANIFAGFLIAGGGPLGFAKGYRVGGDFRVHGPLYVSIEGSVLWDKSTSSVNHITDSADLGGIVYRHPAGKAGAAVFGEVLAGLELFHNSSKSHTWEFRNALTPAAAAEVGADIPVASRWSIRPEGGYFWTLFKNGGGGSGGIPANTIVNRGRADVCLVYRF